MQIEPYILPIIQILATLVVAPFLASISGKFDKLTAKFEELAKELRTEYVSWDRFNERMGEERTRTAQTYRAPPR